MTSGLGALMSLQPELSIKVFVVGDNSDNNSAIAHRLVPKLLQYASPRKEEHSTCKVYLYGPHFSVDI
jgi:hypothetical protein